MGLAATRLGLEPVLSALMCAAFSEDEAWVQSLCPLSCHLHISRLECKTVLGLGNSCLVSPFHAVLLALGLRAKGVIRGQVMVGRQMVEWAGVVGGGAGGNRAQEVV